jgi:hypothetical protein
MSELASNGMALLRDTSRSLSSKERKNIALVLEAMDNELKRREHALVKIAALLGGLSADVDLALALPVLIEQRLRAELEMRP